MQGVYGVAIRKGGQGKSTTVSTLARLCALSGARVLLVDLAQPGTTTASLRDIWIEPEHGELAETLLACQAVPAGSAPSPAPASHALRRAALPVMLASQPSWSGGVVRVLPWDEVLADAAAYLRSERVLEGLLTVLARDVDLVLIDYPAEGGPLLTNALVATHKVLIPLV